jgi:hypothetical protein
MHGCDLASVHVHECVETLTCAGVYVYTEQQHIRVYVRYGDIKLFNLREKFQPQDFVPFMLKCLVRCLLFRQTQLYGGFDILYIL